MNPFEPYAIQHLSPSACNLFIASPAAFVMQKCFHKKTSVGPAAHRGTSVESGIVHGLMTGADDAACVAIALAQFDKLTKFCSGTTLEKELANVPQMVKRGLDELRPYGVPTSTQGKISYDIEGLNVPMIGFYDIEWANHGILLDIKTTGALPASIATNHARQVALYVAARGNNLDPRITYITAKKLATYQLENVADHVQALSNVALTIQRFLAQSSSAVELAKLVIPDIDHYMFNDPQAREAVFSIWGV